MNETKSAQQCRNSRKQFLIAQQRATDNNIQPPEDQHCFFVPLWIAVQTFDVFHTLKHLVILFFKVSTALFAFLLLNNLYFTRIITLNLLVYAFPSK